MTADGFEPYPLALTRRGRGTAPFRYLNALVMTRAERPTADSWVHVAPTAKPPLLGLLVFVAIAGWTGYAATVAWLQVFRVIPKRNDEASFEAVGLGGTVMTVLAALCIWVAALMLLRRLRAGGYGRRPSGVALGRTAIGVWVPGRNIEIAWEHVTEVRAEVLPTGNRRSVPLIALRLDEAANITGNLQMLSAEGYTVPTDALFTALRWYHAHPEAREELGRVEGQRRIEGWREAACARIRGGVGTVSGPERRQRPRRDALGRWITRS